MNMEGHELINLIAPSYKQYLKSLVLCVFIYVLFKVNNGLIIAISIAMIINLLSSMLEATRWTSKILNNEYDLKYAKVSGFIYSAIVTDFVDDYALDYVSNLHVGDKVLLLVIDNEYIVVKKV